MKETKLKKVVQNENLASYDLPKDILAKLKRYDQLHDYCIKANRPPPDALRLFRKDYLAIDVKVKSQSEGKFNASKVFYRGVPLLAHNEVAKPFTLEDAA